MRWALVIVFSGLIGFMGAAQAAESAPNIAVIPMVLTIQNHKFSPERIEVPAGQQIKLTVKNLDATPEEFESKPLHIEKVIKGNSEAVINLNKLTPGEYKFVGEFHEDTAMGVIVVK